MGFLKSNGIYVFIGFIVVLLGVIGFLSFQRLQTPQVSQEQPTPAPDNTADLSFSLDQVTPTPSEEAESEETGSTTEETESVNPETSEETPELVEEGTPIPLPTSPNAAANLTVTPEVGGPAEPTNTQIALGPTLTPTRTVTPTRTPTRTPTPIADESTDLTPFPTTIENPDIAVPDVPQAGGFEPTLIAMLGGSGIVGLAYLLRKTNV